MLSRPCKTHDPFDQGVIATVSPLIPPGKQLVETMGGPLSPTLRHIEA